jgi:hypothetical protein
MAALDRRPCFQFVFRLRSRPSGVRGPVLMPPRTLHRPFGMAAARQGLPVRLDRAPQRGAAFALTSASRRACIRSIDLRARGSLLILNRPPPSLPRLPPPCLPGPARYLVPRDHGLLTLSPANGVRPAVRSGVCPGFCEAFERLRALPSLPRCRGHRPRMAFWRTDSAEMSRPWASSRYVNQVSATGNSPYRRSFACTTGRLTNGCLLHGARRRNAHGYAATREAAMAAFAKSWRRE